MRQDKDQRNQKQHFPEQCQKDGCFRISKGNKSLLAGELDGKEQGSCHIDLASYTIWALRIYMAASLLFAVQLACQQTFIALGNAKTSVFLALLRKVLLLIPLIFILPHFVSNPVFGVFVAEPVADTIAVATTAALFFREYKKLG